MMAEMEDLDAITMAIGSFSTVTMATLSADDPCRAADFSLLIVLFKYILII
jgi:hypothetical protein